ncbi:MAG: SdrD B-like domain-containing protein, partial [Acidobacteriota bacterium]
IVGNRVGTNATGQAALPNGGGPGIRVEGHSNVIGGTGSGSGNLISGNIGTGIWLLGDLNRVQGNTIGLDSSRSDPIGNRFAGIFIAEGADGALIGGTVAIVGNTIAATLRDSTGAGGSGILMHGSATSSIQSNLIGGLGPLGNDRHGIRVTRVGGLVPQQGVIGGVMAGNFILNNGIGADGGHGILVEEADTFFIVGNRIGTSVFGLTDAGNNGDGVRIVESSSIFVGGAVPGEANVIAYNEDNGIGAYDLDASAGLQNTHGNLFSRNVLWRNEGLGIDLTLGGAIADGPTANDDDDSDFGPNRLQNFPTLSPPVHAGGITTLSGELSAAPSRVYQIELYDNSACDPSGFGEARKFLGSLTVTADGLGEAPFSFQTSSFVTFPTALAFDDVTLDTSELSPCVDTAPSGGILGDRVWFDTDGDGLQALGEAGAEGIEVRLLNSAGTVVIDSTTTNADGNYRFVGVATGSYRIEVVAPTDTVLSPLNTGSDDTLDSDVDPTNGLSDVFSYLAGSVDLTLDAGLIGILFGDGFESGDTSRWK